MTLARERMDNTQRKPRFFLRVTVIAASYKDSVRTARVECRLVRELVHRKAHRFLDRIHTLFDSIERGRSQPRLVKLRTRVAKHRTHLNFVVAALCAAAAPGASPRGVSVRHIEGNVAMGQVVHEAHLAPRRQRLSRLCVRHGAGATAQLWAKRARLKIALVNRERRELANGAMVWSAHVELLAIGPHPQVVTPAAIGTRSEVRAHKGCRDHLSG